MICSIFASVSSGRISPVATPRSSYLGSDLRDNAAKLRGEGSLVRPPAPGLLRDFDPPSPTLGSGGGQSEYITEEEEASAHEFVTRRAQEYLGLSPEAAGDMPLEQLLEQLLEAFPEDQEFARAAEVLSSSMGTNMPGREKRGITFRPDRP